MTTAFRAALEQAAAAAKWHIEERPPHSRFSQSHGLQRYLFSRHGGIACVSVEPTSEDTGFVCIFCRTTSWDLPGERTDYHDIYSVVLASYLTRIKSPFSCTLWDVAHPVTGIPTELYARYLTVGQPLHASHLTLPSDIDELRVLLTEIAFFELIFPLFFTWPANHKTHGTVDHASEWGHRVAAALNERFDEKVQCNARSGPDWLHYRSIRRHASVVASAGLVEAMARLFPSPAELKSIPGVRSTLFVGPRVCCAIQYSVIARAKKALSGLHGALPEPLIVIPLENYAVVAGGEYTLFLYGDCGLHRYQIERERVRERHAIEARVLFPASHYEWAAMIDDERFELLVRDLLTREPGVERVRKVGRSRDADAGRDLIADWVTHPVPGAQLTKSEVPRVVRKVLVQAKASRRSVNKQAIRDIRDTIDHHSASGYFLAVASHITSDLTDHLDRLRTNGTYWIDWGNREEVEERLDAAPAVAKKYSDIVVRRERE